MSLNKLGRVIFAGALFLEACTATRPPKPKEDIVETTAITTLREHFSALAKADLADGKDNIDEQATLAAGEHFLAQLKQKNPAGYRIFLLQLKILIQQRKTARSDEDVQEALQSFDLPTIYRRLQNRAKIVQPNGTVHFASPEDERKIGLSELTTDDEILFEAKNLKTSQIMGIASQGPFKCFRVTRPSSVDIGNKKIDVPAGTFVVRSTQGTFIKVVVYEGDHIVDSLTRAMEPTVVENAQAVQLPAEFEEFWRIKISQLPVERGRQLYGAHFQSYKMLLTGEYRELLTKEGVSIPKHFVYFVQWSAEHNLPPNEEAMRVFFDELVALRRRTTSAVGTEGKKDTIGKASDALNGKKDEDENRLSYHDQRVKDTYGQADIVRKRHGALFAIVRLQGSFFDTYTYNRLTGNYTARVSAATVGNEEYLRIDDIFRGITKASSDIAQNARVEASLVEYLNATTQYNRDLDEELRKALAFSASHLDGVKATPNDFAVRYGPKGNIVSITFRGKAYDTRSVLASPDRLKQIPNDTVTLNAGGVTVKIRLQDYFEGYRRLEAQNANRSQMTFVYDTKEGQVRHVRNAMWFAEDGSAPLYKTIAQAATQDASTPSQKLLALARWSQANFNYLDEATEINKTTLATLFDRGGDCEDSATAFKTFAQAIGLGGEVGAVMFEGHIAPIVRGKFGPTTYTIDGEVYTVVELATNRRVVPPGVTPRKDPWFFILPNGTMRSATGKMIPLKIVQIGRLDAALVSNFQSEVKAIEAFVSTPANQPSPANNARVAEVSDQLKVLFERLKGSYAAIAKTGQMAEAIFDQMNATSIKITEFADRFAEKVEEQEDRKRVFELTNAPAQIQEAIRAYQTDERIVLTNLAPAIERIARVMKQYDGRENDHASMKELLGKMIKIINESGVYPAVQRMQQQYEDTLRHLAEPYRGKIKADMDEKNDWVQKGVLDPYNAVLRMVDPQIR